MDLAKYIKVIWLYALGELLIFLGFYVIVFDYLGSISGPAGFGLMMPGLFVCMVGGFYGKKKLLEGERLPKSVADNRQIDQIKQNVLNQLKPPGTPADPKDPPKTAEAKAQQPAVQATHEAQSPETAQEGVVRIMVCPGCNTENPPTNMFCFSCGKKLRASPRAAKSKQRKKAG